MDVIRNPKRFLLIITLSEAIIFFGVIIFLFANSSVDTDTWISILISFAALVFVEVLVWHLFRPMLKQQAIIQEGSPAAAILLDYWDTGTTINENPQVGMLLEVHPSNLAPYQAKTKSVLSRLDLGMLHKGAAVKVTYMPADPQEVAFVAFATSQDQTPGPGIEQSGGLYSQSDLIKVRLAELDELRLRHMITEADYTRRRDELLKSPPPAR
jgi:hypothetical protein